MLHPLSLINNNNKHALCFVSAFVTMLTSELYAKNQEIAEGSFLLAPNVHQQELHLVYWALNEINAVIFIDNKL